MNLQLSIIIVNYNGLKYLKDCFDAMYEKLKGISFEIILIDNNSSDDSCAFIKQNYPQIILIESKINYGFGRGNNEAVKIAKAENLLLINNDTILLDDLKPVLEFLVSDKTIGVLGINMLDGNKNYLPAAGVFPNKINMLQLKKLLNVNQDFATQKFKNESYNVDWLCGSFLMLTKNTYDKIGGFDEDYFLYVEDVDFCKKIEKIGLKRVFLPSFSYIHFVGFNKSKNKLLIKGYQTFIRKHFIGLEKSVMLAILQTNNFVKNIKRTFKLD